MVGGRGVDNGAIFNIIMLDEVRLSKASLRCPNTLFLVTFLDRK